MLCNKAKFKSDEQKLHCLWSTTREVIIKSWENQSLMKAFEVTAWSSESWQLQRGFDSAGDILRNGTGYREIKDLDTLQEIFSNFSRLWEIQKLSLAS